MTLWTFALAVKSRRVNAGVKNGEGYAIEYHPVAGKAANNGRWRVAGLLLLRLAGGGGEKHNKVEDGVAEKDVTSATHPDGTASKSNLPEVFAVGIPGSLQGGKHGRNPDNEDANMKSPNERAAGNGNSCESHAMRRDAESESARSKHHERIKNDFHLLSARGVA